MRCALMRWLGILSAVATACTTEPAIVAILDSAGAGGPVLGGALGAGRGGADPSTSGSIGGRAPALGGVGGVWNPSGTSGEPAVAGDGSGASAGGMVFWLVTGDAGSSGATETTPTVCACGEQAPVFCGSDGITYPTTPCGTDCPVAVSCFHECPCLPEEPLPDDSFWFATGGPAATECATGLVCFISRPLGGE